jgi:hypothetical protein
VILLCAFGIPAPADTINSGNLDFTVTQSSTTTTHPFTVGVVNRSNLPPLDANVILTDFEVQFRSNGVPAPTSNWIAPSGWTVTPNNALGTATFEASNSSSGIAPDQTRGGFEVDEPTIETSVSLTVVSLSTTTVPEPGALPLLSLAAIGLVMLLVRSKPKRSANKADEGGDVSTVIR